MREDLHVRLAEVIATESSSGDCDRDVLAHLKDCENCRTIAQGYAALRKVVKELPRPEPPRSLREEIVHLAESLAAQELKRRKFQRLKSTILVALAVSVVFLVGTFLWTRNRSTESLQAPTPAPSSAESIPTLSGQASIPAGPRPAFVSKGRSFDDTQKVRAALRNDPTIAAFRQYYKASDVGSNQRSMQFQLAELAGGVNGRSPAECMNVILRGVPRPTLPAYVERASYAGSDAWLIVLVYAPDTAPDTPLSGIIFYAMAVKDCTFLATAFWE